MLGTYAPHPRHIAEWMEKQGVRILGSSEEENGGGEKKTKFS